MPDTDTNKQPLTGLCIWVTRPQHQSASIVHSLETLGASTIAMPLLAIEEVQDTASLARLAQLQDYNLVIFVSANAVEFAARHLPKLAEYPDCAAIGSATAAKCREYGLNVQFIPEHSDSDGLLTLPRFDALAGQRILIVRGQGGRAYLGEQLQQRGAQVDYAEVYRRQLPDTVLTAGFARADVILITSSAALTYLVGLARRDQQAWIFDKQLLVIHERIAGRVSEQGFTLKPIVAKQANDTGMLEVLASWAQFQQE